MIATIITSIAKPVIAGVMTISMAVNSMFTGPAGGYAELQNKAYSITPAKTETQISLTVDLEKIAALSGEEISFKGEIENIPGIYKDGKIDINATVYTVSDLDNTKLAISLKEDLAEGYVVYIDENGLAVTPKLVDAALGIYSVVSAEGQRMYNAYKAYYGDNGVYLKWNDVFGIESNAETEGYLKLISEYLTIIVDDVVKIMTSEENLKAFYEIYKPVFDAAGKYYNGTSSSAGGYGAKLTGAQLLELCSLMCDTMYTEDAANKIYDYFLGLADDVDYIKYIDIIKAINPQLAGAALPENVTNAQISLLIRGMLEEYRTGFVAGYTSVDGGEISDMIEVILTGKDEKDLFSAEEEKVITEFIPFLNKSTVEFDIVEKNGVIYESGKITISDGKTEYAGLEVTTGTSKFEGTLPDTEAVVPFDKRVETQELENKIGYENALEKGIHNIEIMWDSSMAPKDNKVVITSPCFDVYYNTSMIESMKKDPAFQKYDEETQKLLLGIYTEEDKEFVRRHSSAEIIDNSVYLPLRQLMENAGYEVSWDGEARKAYVTVGGEKIEMTGVIVRDRTYVKVRDFEKLGAIVDYSEEFNYQNAYNDYGKSCIATISFKKSESTALSPEEIIAGIYEQKAPLFMIASMPVDLNDEFSYKTYLGLEDVSEIKEAAVSESMIGAQAYSLVVARVKEGADAKAVAEKMKAGIDPRKWVCVQADDIKCTTVGDLICFCMISSDFKDAFTADDAMAAFTKVVNG